MMYNYKEIIEIEKSDYNLNNKLKNKELTQYQNKGYSYDDARSKLCQDILLSKISKSS